MKKFKLFMPALITVSAFTSVIIPISSCSKAIDTGHAKQSISFEKEQECVNKAQYILDLDDSYNINDIKIEIIGQDSKFFSIYGFVSGKQLVIQATPIDSLEHDGETYTIGFNVTILGLKQTFDNLKVTMKLMPTDDIHLHYEKIAEGECSVSFEAFSESEEEQLEERKNWSVKTLYIPKTKDGMTVVSVANNGFKNCSGIKRLILPDTIKTIGQYAFECKESKYYEEYYTQSNISTGSIESIEFIGQSSLTTIGYSAFSGQKSLKSVILPASVEEIGAYAFCVKDTEVTIPDPEKETTLNKINNVCNGNLTELIFEQNSKLKTIGREAFSGHKQLKSIVFPSTIKNIDFRTFSCIDELNTFDYEKEIWSQSRVCCGQLENIAFNQTDESDSLIIGQYCFEGQKELTSITLPKNLKEMKDMAFECIERFEQYNYKTGDYTNNKICAGKLETISFDSECTLDLISPYTFHGQKELNSVNIPKNITEIGNNAFDCVDYYENGNVTTNKSVGKLTNIVFDNDSKLEKIKSNAFSGQKELQNLSLPKTLSLIDASAFNCLDKTQASESVITQKCVGKLEKFELNAEDTLITIGSYAFAGQSSLKVFGYKADDGLLLPNSVTSIEEGAFYNFEIDKTTNDDAWTPTGGFNSINIDIVNSNLATIENYAFAGQAKITTINIPPKANISWYGGGMFVGDNKLTDIKISPNNTNFQTIEIDGKNAVLISGNQLIDWPSANGEIDMTDEKFQNIHELINCFSYNNNISSVKFYKTYCSIIKAFNNCVNLTSINFNEAGVSWDTHYGYPFAGCPSLSKFLNINSDWHKTFKDDSILATRVDPMSQNYEIIASANPNGPIDFSDESEGLDSVVALSDYAFYEQNINIISFGNIETIGSYCFANAKFSNTIIGDNIITSIGADAFTGSNITSFKFYDPDIVEGKKYWYYGEWWGPDEEFEVGQDLEYDAISLTKLYNQFYLSNRGPQ